MTVVTHDWSGLGLDALHLEAVTSLGALRPQNHPGQSSQLPRSDRRRQLLGKPYPPPAAAPVALGTPAGVSGQRIRRLFIHRPRDARLLLPVGGALQRPEPEGSRIVDAVQHLDAARLTVAQHLPTDVGQLKRHGRLLSGSLAAVQKVEVPREGARIAPADLQGQAILHLAESSLEVIDRIGVAIVDRHHCRVDRFALGQRCGQLMQLLRDANNTDLLGCSGRTERPAAGQHGCKQQNNWFSVHTGFILD